MDVLMGDPETTSALVLCKTIEHQRFWFLLRFSDLTKIQFVCVFLKGVIANGWEDHCLFFTPSNLL